MPYPAEISVIMPVLNGEHHIETALRSLLQEEPALDIIVVDNGSTDRTEEIVSAIMLEYPEVRWVRSPQPGVSMARNLGLASIPETTKYITFLDCDDINPPGCLARQLKLLKQRREYECVIGLLCFFKTAEEKDGLEVPVGKTMTIRGIQLATTLFSRAVFDKVGSFNEEMQHGEDTDFFLRLLEAKISYAMENEVAVFYRRHEENMTNNLQASRRGFMDAIRRSLARRRKTGLAVDLGDLFKARSQAEEVFRND